MSSNFKEKFKTQIQKQLEELEALFDKEKERYSSIEHFCDLGLYNLENNTNFQPEEMSHEMIIELNNQKYKLLDCLEE